MKIYILYDGDINDLEVFASLEEAKARADVLYPEDSDEPWVKSGKEDMYRAEYQYIFVRDIPEPKPNAEKPRRTVRGKKKATT